MEIGRASTILGPDWNRRFNRADNADGGDGKADYHAGARCPATGWRLVSATRIARCQTRVARSHQAFLQNRLLAHVKSSQKQARKNLDQRTKLVIRMRCPVSSSAFPGPHHPAAEPTRRANAKHVGSSHAGRPRLGFSPSAPQVDHLI